MKQGYIQKTLNINASSLHTDLKRMGAVFYLTEAKMALKFQCIKALGIGINSIIDKGNQLKAKITSIHTTLWLKYNQCLFVISNNKHCI